MSDKSILAVVFRKKEYYLELDENIVFDNNIYGQELVSFNTYYSIHNITTNIRFFRFYNGSERKTLNSSGGFNEISDFDRAILELVQEEENLSDDDLARKIGFNETTCKSEVTLKNNYRMDCRIITSFRNILGFDSLII